MRGYAKAGVVGAADPYFAAVVDGTIDPELERKVLALKEGFPSLPATTCATILKGLNGEIQAFGVGRMIDTETGRTAVRLPRVTGEVGGIFIFRGAPHRPAGGRIGR